MESAFEGLVLYVRYAKVKRDCFYRAQDFLQTSLLKKALAALTEHRNFKREQKDMISQVRKMRRRQMFINWFNHVHDFLPKKKY